MPGSRSSSTSSLSSDSSLSTRAKVKSKASEFLGSLKSLVKQGHENENTGGSTSLSGTNVSSVDHPINPTPPNPTSGPHHHARRLSFWANDVDHNDLIPDMSKPRAIIWSILTALFVVFLIIALGFPNLLALTFYPWIGMLPRDPMLAALAILDRAPIIDGHIDLPILARSLYANNASAIDLDSGIPGHVDIPRLRQGKVGGFFWSVYVQCGDPQTEGPDFVNGSWRVRDTLEQIDIATELIQKYPSTFQPVYTASSIREAIQRKKIASFIGAEGAHQLGNSLAVLRQYYALGVRYITLTHTCHNAFADSSSPSKPLHNGLSPLGRTLVDEMNRLGMLVDLSHTSDDTAAQVLAHSEGPVIWSHSSARAVHNHSRNVPDELLSQIGTSDDKKEGIIMVNFNGPFVGPDPTVELVADHVEHIAKISGKDCVGIGSDFDGIADVPHGLEDVSRYPNLIAELYSRGWTKYELAGLTGGNLIRVFSTAERFAYDLRATGARPAYDLYDKRPDLPVKRNEL